MANIRQLLNYLRIIFFSYLVKLILSKKGKHRYICMHYYERVFSFLFYIFNVFLYLFLYLSDITYMIVKKEYEANINVAIRNKSQYLKKNPVFVSCVSCIIKSSLLQLLGFKGQQINDKTYECSHNTDIVTTCTLRLNARYLFSY